MGKEVFRYIAAAIIGTAMLKSKAGAIVSACENRSNGILNTYKLFVENGATLKVEENHDRGIRNVRELTLNAGSVCKIKRVQPEQEFSMREP